MSPEERHTDVRLPQWGMGMTDGMVVAWYKAPGDRVDEGEPLADIETSKVTAVLESPVSGTLSAILVETGEVAQVFDVLAQIREE